jgi:soluble lytic murein transglycosylase-like protein
MVLSILFIVLIERCTRADAHTGHDHIPLAAEQYRRQLTREVRYYMGLREPVSRFGAQVHQESAWRSGAQSKYAAGLAQFTPGTSQDMARIYPKDLEGKATPLDPWWALRAMVLYMKRLRDGLSNFGEDAHAAALVSYNGGGGWLLRERKAAARAGADPQRWFGQVEHHCLRAQWACEESRNYPRKILFRWWPLYQKAGW